MASYGIQDVRPRSSSSKYVPENYYGRTSSSPRRSSQSYHRTEEPHFRPFTPPDPAQYNTSPDYRVPVAQLRPPNPDVQAVQIAEGFVPRSQSHERRLSHGSMTSHHSHRSHQRSRLSSERPGHERQASHRSHRSSHSGHGSHHRRSDDVPYRTEKERQEYIKQLKRLDSRRPTLGGSLFSMWQAMKNSWAK